MISLLVFEQNDDFLGDVRLALAVVFERKKMIREAGIELNLYKENRQKNKWKIGADFDELTTKINLMEGSNTEKYKELKGMAEEFAFNDLPWISLVYIDSFKDKNMQ